MPVKHTTRGFAFPECEGDVIQVRDLSFAYPDGHVALQEISLRLCQGDKVALVGPNGAGKSTLMLHLNGILAAEGGEVQVAGMPVNEQSRRLWRGGERLVLQNPDDQRYSATVFEDVAFGTIHMGLREAEV